MSFNPFGIGLQALSLFGSALLDPKQIQDLQEHRFRQILTHAYQYSPFCHLKYQHIDLDTVALIDLPVMHKAELMGQFNEWICDPDIALDTLKVFISNPANVGSLYLGKYVVWESSGSSGASAIFIQDEEAMDVYDALESVRQSKSEFLQHALDPLLLTERVALVAAINGHFASNISFELAKSMRGYFASPFTSISILDPIKKVVEELNAFSPTIIATYPTAAVVLADAILEGSLTVSPKEIWTGGETLTPAMRKYVQDRFKAKVRCSYGSSEFFEIAWECDAGHMHVNADWVILEAVDKNYQPVPAGQMSHTCLLTNLANRVQPIIRYDLGDSICFHETRCACGSNLPCIDVLGRADDLIKVPSDEGTPVSILPLALTTAIEEATGIFDFQIMQKNANTLIIRLPPRSCLDGNAADDMNRCVDAIKSFLKTQGATHVRFIKELNSQMKFEKSGKLKRILTQH